jgi:hypothetical protein
VIAGQRPGGHERVPDGCARLPWRRNAVPRLPNLFRFAFPGRRYAFPRRPNLFRFAFPGRRYAVPLRPNRFRFAFPVSFASGSAGRVSGPKRFSAVMDRTAGTGRDPHPLTSEPLSVRFSSLLRVRFDRASLRSETFSGGHGPHGGDRQGPAGLAARRSGIGSVAGPAGTGRPSCPCGQSAMRPVRAAFRRVSRGSGAGAGFRGPPRLRRGTREAGRCRGQGASPPGAPAEGTVPGAGL